MLLMGTPPWANGGESWQWVPDWARDFGDFATAIARCYPSVMHWMIWGEPNRKPNFQPFDPRDRAANRQAERGPAGRAAATTPCSSTPPTRRSRRESPDNLVIGGNTYTAAGTDDISP